jgi:hypothetical protein
MHIILGLTNKKNTYYLKIDILVFNENKGQIIFPHFGMKYHCLMRLLFQTMIFSYIKWYKNITKECENINSQIKERFC